MSEKVVVKLIGAEVVRLSLQPGDVLVVSIPGSASRAMTDDIRCSFREVFGVPVVLMREGIQLKALISVSPEIPNVMRIPRAEEEAKRMQSIADALTKEPSNA